MVKDIWDENKNEFKTATQLGVPWWELAALKSAISEEWKYFLHNKEAGRPGKVEKPYHVLFKSNNVTRQAYNTLIYDKFAVHKYYLRWLDRGLTELNYEDYVSYFGRLYYCTKMTKYRDFQYRLNLGKIILNSDLYDWKLMDSKACTFCGTQDETMVHLFWHCEMSKHIIAVFERICEMNKLEYELNIYSWLFNTVGNNKSHIINFVAILAKQYLYRSRCGKIIPSSHAFLKELENLFQVESAIAKVCNKIRKHEKKWGPLTKHNK